MKDVESILCRSFQSPLISTFMEVPRSSPDSLFHNYLFHQCCNMIVSHKGWQEVTLPAWTFVFFNSHLVSCNNQGVPEIKNYEQHWGHVSWWTQGQLPTWRLMTGWPDPEDWYPHQPHPGSSVTAADTSSSVRQLPDSPCLFQLFTLLMCLTFSVRIIKDSLIIILMAGSLYLRNFSAHIALNADFKYFNCVWWAKFNVSHLMQSFSIMLSHCI